MHTSISNQAFVFVFVIIALAHVNTSGLLVSQPTVKHVTDDGLHIARQRLTESALGAMLKKITKPSSKMPPAFVVS